MKKIIAVAIVIVLFSICFIIWSIQNNKTYTGMTIIPEKTSDIPLFKGLKPGEYNYTLEGDHWREIGKFYKKELPKNGWKSKYSQFTDDGNFYSTWMKDGFDGELWVGSYYNKAEKQTVVSFDKQKK